MSEAIAITGWGQVTQPKNATPPFLDPIDMMERAARDAGAQAGAGVLETIDAMLLVRTQSRSLTDPGGELARRLGARPRLVRVSGIGGEVPQRFVNQAAGLLARGEAETVLICGAETYYPRSADAVRGERALTQGIPANYANDDAVGSNALEQRHGLILPIHGFPLFETALWAGSGLTRAQALARAAAKAQARAGMHVRDLECFDLYSCFPCAVSVARRELGLRDGDPRPLTLTGGLGFFGGPGSNYALHGIATMAETIASGRYRSGMTTALGWFMHKYAAGIYGATPNDVDLSACDREDDAHPEAGGAPVAIAQSAEGRGRIETYTVIYDRDLTPARALVYGRTEDGQRFVANTAGDAATYAELTGENQVGRAVRLSTVEGLNRAEFAA